MSQASNIGHENADTHHADVLVVGAGLAGLYILYSLRQRGLTARAFEAASDVGGTWYWNRYPGARVDVDSVQYSYNFSDELIREWVWTEKFASQSELLRYINHVADRFDLRRDIRFNTRVTSAVFDENANLWSLKTDQGDIATGSYCIMATGSLSAPFKPNLPGLESFGGDCYQTATWPHEEVKLGGKRIGIIGTGSTGIQAIPVLAEQAKHLTVFQRTAQYTTPARNKPITVEEQREFNSCHAEYYNKVRHTFSGVTGFPTPTKCLHEDTPEERLAYFEKRWKEGGMLQSMLGTYTDININAKANEIVANFVRDKIHETVNDPEVAALLAPSKDLPIGSKRLPIDTDYYETYNRKNVTLVDVRRDPIEHITPTGLKTGSAEYNFDILIFATGFDAMTGALLAIDIRTESGARLQDLWSQGPDSYLGLMVAGLPNFFIINGPGSPSVKSNMIITIEHHTDWIMDLLDYVSVKGFDRIEATKQAQNDWVEHAREVAEATLMPIADSWYVGANIPGKKRVYMPYFGGFDRYCKTCDEIVADGYRGFTLSRLKKTKNSSNFAAE